MNDKEFAPLSPACVRALNDKMYEKRKGAALEIEKMVREFHVKNNSDQVARILKILGEDFAMSLNPQPRKGGLIGLAACAIALGKDSAFYTSNLVKPVLSCFHDPDCRVRYYACESLYNIVKVARGSVLPHFNEIFDGLSKLAADPDQNVRSGSETLDRLMKDIVTESSAFDLMTFIPLLRERIYVTNSFARRFIVSWITMLDATPDIDMLVFLPEILDGMFKILGDIQPEISKQCEVAFGEFLKGISNAPPGRVNYKGMVNIVLSHCMAQDTSKDLIQYTAMLWLKEFVHLAGQDMLKFASGIISAVLPCLAMGDRQKSIREVAKDVNRMMMKLVSSEDDAEKTIRVDDLNDLNRVDMKGEPGTETNNQTTDQGTDQSAIEEPLDLSAVVKALCKHLSSKKMETRIASLEWIYHLHIKTPNKIFQHVEELFPLLLMTLSDPADEVVLLDLEVLAEISSSPVNQRAAINTNEQAALPSPIQKAVSFQDGMNTYFTKFMISLLGMFRTDSQLLENRGSFIIRQLGLLLQAEHIYRSLAEILLHEDDLKFASVMVQTLNTILLTSTELFELRNQLKEFRSKESHSLFTCLYRSWCHNPVATVSLCLLTQSYKHSCDLLQYFGDLEVTVDFLTEIDKLIQLLESPIFTFLRLQLLDVENNHFLVKSLYGLLMLVPQSEAFRTLRNRLECVPNVRFSTHNLSADTSKQENNQINFQDLLVHFEEFQVKHRQNRRKLRQQQVSRTVRY